MISKKQISLLREKQTGFLSQKNKTKILYAEDAMIKPVFLYSDDNVNLILKKLKKEHVNACIVVSKEKKFLGEVSDNDILKLFLQQIKHEPLVKLLNIGYRRKFLYKTAKDMVNKHKSFVRKDTPINLVLKLAQKEGFEYIPVLDNQDKVVGVITPSSIIKLLKNY